LQIRRSFDTLTSHPLLARPSWPQQRVTLFTALPLTYSAPHRGLLLVSPSIRPPPSMIPAHHFFFFLSSVPRFLCPERRGRDYSLPRESLLLSLVLHQPKPDFLGHGSSPSVFEDSPPSFMPLGGRVWWSPGRAKCTNNSAKPARAVIQRRLLGPLPSVFTSPACRSLFPPFRPAPEDFSGV